VDIPYRLLIVEDEPNTGAMLQEYFGLKGYEVCVTGWGKEAIVQCQQDPPDLVVLDIHLPDIDGYEVYARIRQQWRTQCTPVIFLTERKSRNDRITGLQLGAVDYITKPFDLEELALRVHNALRQVELARMVNPVTSLPVGREMKERLRPLVGRGEWAALYVCLQNLESFSEVYGSPESDRVLRAVANTLNEVVIELGSDKDFVGHLCEVDFVVVTSPARVGALQEEIAARLPHALRPFATPRRKDAGSGVPATMLFSVAIGALSGSDLPPEDDENISRKLARGGLSLDLLSLDS